MTYTYQTGTPGLGATLSFTPDGGSLTAVAQIQSIDGPSVMVGNWKSTGLSSTWGEKLPTLPEGEDITMTLIWSAGDTGHALVYSTMVARTICDYTVTVPAAIGPSAGGSQVAHTITHKGFFSGFALSGISSEEYITAQVKITPIGEVKIQAAS